MDSVRLRLTACAALLLGACHTPKPAGPSLALLSGGFTVTEKDVFVEGGVEIRSAPAAYGLGVMAGATLVEGGGRYVYGGLRWSRALDEAGSWLLIPSIAAGLYDNDDAHHLDLGGSLEFRSALELSYAVTEWARLGVYVAHLSNASIYDRNGGAETAGLTLTFDLGGWMAER